MSRGIYPGYGREGAFTHKYCEIAMESYYQAMQAQERLKKLNYSQIDDDGDYWRMNKNIITTVVFSAMAIESFLNDYAAACLGDKEFYENFDRLSVMSKLQLIVTFIMHAEMDKSKIYYSLMKALFSCRDKFVHNKSKKMKFQGYTKEELDQIERWQEENDYVPEEPVYDAQDIAKDMRMGRDALRAMRELAAFFDAHDENICAQFRFFGSSLEFFVCEPYQKEIFQLLKIPVEKV